MSRGFDPAWTGRSKTEIFDYGRERHRAGELEAAEAAYRHFLALGAEEYEANAQHLLGLVLYHQQRLEEAVPHFTKAIELRGDYVRFYNNAALAYLELGRLEEAEAICRRALPLDPAYSLVRCTLGITLRAAGRLDEAELWSREALKLDPGHVGAHCQLGFILSGLGRLDEAVESFRAALALDAEMVEAHLGLGAALRLLGCPAEAEACYRAALRIDADIAEAHNSLGTLLSERDRHAEAESYYRAAIALDPNYGEAHNNLGATLLELGRLEESDRSLKFALDCQPDLPAVYCNLGNLHLAREELWKAEQSYKLALVLDPDYSEAHFALGALQLRLRRVAEAEASFRAVLRLDPDHLRAHIELAHLFLLTGQFKEGWRHYERRVGLPGAGLRHFPQARWHGEALGEQTLLVHAEQGFGDTLQFCRYLPLLARRARQARIFLEVQPPLMALLSGLPGIAGIVAAGDKLPPFDLHCPLLSVPHIVGTTMATIPDEIPYLAADPERSLFWRGQLATLDGLRVGLVWAGGARPNQPGAVAIDRRRSMSLAQMAPLAGLEGVNFVSLQKGEPARQALRPPDGMVLHDVAATFDDFSETAALIDALDLVISVDTAVAHLAGALGKPVWLLNRFDSCWRWLLTRNDSPWYPTLRQFRQPAAGDWASVLQQVRAALIRGDGRQPPAVRPPKAAQSH